MNKEILIDNNSFSEIECKELQNIDGGGFLAATWVVVKVLGITAGTGFVCGAIYETVFGD